jgi:WD40 repeat protein
MMNTAKLKTTGQSGRAGGVSPLFFVVNGGLTPPARQVGPPVLKTLLVIVLVLGAFACAGERACWTLAEEPLSPKSLPQVRKDPYGDPLPEGARLRMGTIQLRHNNAQVVFSSDGRTLISCGEDGLVRHWDLATGRLVRELQLCKTTREKKELMSVSLGRRCAALKMKDAVLFRDVESGEERGRLALKTEQGDRLTLSPDAKFLVVERNIGPNHDPTTAELWDVVRAKKVQSMKDEENYGIWKVVFSRDGKRVALRAGGRDLRLWDTTTGKELRANEHTSWATCFSPDGKTLAINIPGGPVKLLDTATLKEQGQLKRPKDHIYPLLHFDYSADGRLLAGISGEGTVIWDVASRTVKQRLPERYATALAFAPDGKTLVCWGWELGSEIRLRDTATGKQLHSRPGHGNRVDVLALSPDGKIVASGALHDPSLHLWDAATGRLLHRLKGRDDWLIACAFSADGKQLVTSGWRGSLQLWDVDRAKEVRRLEVPGRPAGNLMLSSAQFYLRPSPDGKRLSAILLHYDSPSRVIVWDLTSGKTLSQRPYKVKVHRRDQPGGGSRMWIEADVALTKDGQSVTERKDKRLAIEDVKSGRILALLPEKVGRPVRFSSDGQLVAAAALKPKDDPFESADMEGLRLIESATGQEVVSIKTGQGYLLDFSRDGRLLASIDEEGIHIWDVATGKQFFRRPWPASVAPNPDRAPATSLAFLPDGRSVVTGMEDGTILVWDVPARPSPRQPKENTLEALWTALAGEAREAHRAIYALAATPTATVSFLADRLKLAAEVDGKQLMKLFADLDSDRFETREAAAKELLRLCDDIEPALRRFLESKPSLEARRRIEAILDSPRPVPTAATLRTLRAIRVLEMIGTLEARHLLRKLAGGASGARETREAAAALARLERRSSLSP